ncbi:MAG: hypothetical protein A2887_00820 [Alphaproteobacteria bacterium RIFCSPLOWO2_01_FULL_40_26]|nr:MAG: hypothetical protein A3D15_02445 [Alphaproteobacteria bacterium RIFCSPHIGHO2_02_FULL_40_34]OFW88470.1 MAG: hypothetical protein A2794_01065 [Alphaproteobacteria bacterium RIFCSPHIGHO2_01_FULL_40_8]OFW95251.1 MAG: hypothetical protein A2887_00820 [Alphaproteobacteria bacterium RIFCSPLOWO2_01_FULL_40_26]OFX09347.1 MAG: hypothetical protein A3H30_06775 [Alphaproteobacteria bacterium RIFCSPLOWO2_02_FULL_40_19]OFX11879.1 MAG: hypothetical protein A3G22_05595 [Alphaproteobacteria bacterium RI
MINLLKKIVLRAARAELVSVARAELVSVACAELVSVCFVLRLVTMHEIKKLFLLVFLTFSFSSFAAPSRNLTIFAEPNMALALTKIARIYSQKSNVVVSVNFSSNGDLINAIEMGEPADIFISAHQGWIESLRQKGLTDVYNISYIAEDQLVLTTLKLNPNLPAELSNQNLHLDEALMILDKNKATLLIDNGGNSSGYSAQNFVKNFSFNHLKIFNKISEDKTPFLNLIKSSDQNYALLLASQIKNNDDFQILATKKDDNVFYQALAIAGDNMEIAREFLKFLKSEAAKSTLKESGFLVY